MVRSVVVVAAIALTSATAAASDAETLARWMTGSFSSAAQAAEDGDFLDIRLHMVPIWPERTDGHWLYVEQAVAEAQDRPYRQRVYRVREVAPGLFESAVYSLADPAALVGAWRAERPLAALAPGDLVERDGCAVYLKWTGDAFSGSTLGRLCGSALRGASFATSEVTVTDGRVASWDRGYDAAGVQVWGAEKAGYVFLRTAPDDG